MAARVLRSSLKDASFNKLKLRCGVGPRRYSTASEAAGRAAPEIPHSSKKGRFLTGAMIGLAIAGGAYVSTIDEATYCGWLFKATRIVNPFFALLEAEVAHRLAVSAAAHGFVPREK